GRTIRHPDGHHNRERSHSNRAASNYPPCNFAAQCARLGLFIPHVLQMPCQLRLRRSWSLRGRMSRRLLALLRTLSPTSGLRLLGSLALSFGLALSPFALLLGPTCRLCALFCFAC